MSVPSVTFLQPGPSPEMMWEADIYTIGGSRLVVRKRMQRDSFLVGAAWLTITFVVLSSTPFPMASLPFTESQERTLESDLYIKKKMIPLGGWSHDPLSMLDQKEQFLTFAPET